MATTIYINGTDQTDDIEYKTVRFNRGIGAKPSVLRFRMRNLTTLIDEGDVVEVWEDSDLLFSGLVMAHTTDSPLPEKRMDLSVTNWFDALAQRLVRKSYEDKTLEEIVQDVIAERVLDPDLRLMFQFEEGSGTTVNDSSQHENDGTINGGGSSWGNYYVELSGASGTYISVPDDSSLDITNNLSICFEVNMDVLNRTLIEKDEGATSTPSSSESPSASPSESPSTSPTPSASVSPSSSPSSSESPSVSPSASPSSSESPSESPSSSPSASASPSSSESPSQSPSASPSSSESPSVSPSQSPSVSPSESPSESPSQSPSESPSESPSSSPSASASPSSSESPSESPSSSPSSSESPSESPSLSPSASASPSSSESPSVSPSVSPSLPTELAPYRVSVDHNGEVVFSVADIHSVYNLSTDTQPISIGTTYTIVCTFEKSSGEGKIYVDGALVKSGTLTVNSLRTSTGVLEIGEQVQEYDGKIYRCSLYNKALNAKEIRRWHIDAFEAKAPTRTLSDLSTESFDRIRFSYEYPHECFTHMAEMLGLNWYIDEQMFVNFIELTGTSVATFDEDDGTIIKGAKVDTFLTDVKNKVFVRGGLYLGSWGHDLLEGNGSDTVFALPYKYNSFEMFTDTVGLCSYVQSWFKMEEAAGNLADAFGVNELVAANLTYQQTGKLSDAIDFNGTTSEARKAAATHDTGNTAHSITAWINADTHDGTDRIVAGFGDFANGHSKISIILSGGTYYMRHNFGDSIVTDVETGDLSGGWHLLGISYDPDATDGKTLRTYLDGALGSTTILTSTPDIDAGVMEIGGNNGSNVFDGDIDEVTFFKYALSDQEQEAIYNMGNTSAVSAILLRSGVEFLDTTGFDAYYNYQEKNYGFGTAPSDGDILYPTGKPEVTAISVRSDAPSQLNYGERHMHIIDTSIESQVLAASRATAEVAKRKDPRVIINFSTYTSGIDPGEIITMTMSSYGISDDYFVQKVNTRAHLPVTSGSKKWIYDIECSNVVSRDWIDFLREELREKALRDTPTADIVENSVDHAETIQVADTHSIKTPTDYAETIEVDDSTTLNEVTSGNYKWSDDAGTTVDKLRWNIGDWG